MGDSYDAAQQALEQQRRDYLAAMAQAGSQGAQEFTNAQNDLNGQKSAAVQAALAEAARRGAPQGMQDSVAYQTAQPYDRRTADLTSSNASRSASFGANQSAGDTVISQAIANIPALRAMSQRQAEAERFKVQMQQAQDALDMQLKNVDLQIATANRDRARSGGGSSTDPLLEEGRGLANELKRQQLDKGGASDQQQAVLQDAQQHLGGTSSNGYRVLQTVLSKAKNYNDALGGLDYAYKNNLALTPGGHPLDRGALESFISQYYA